MGGSEILVILVVALLFLGPEKLPEAAQKISKGIRDLRKQTRELQHTIESDSQIGGAIRDLKSALRGDEPARRPPPIAPKKEAPPTPAVAAPDAEALPEAAEAPAEAPAEDDGDGDAAALIRPAAGTVAKGAGES